jgi:hypothetical protein
MLPIVVLTLTLSRQGEGNTRVTGYFFLAFLAAGFSALHMTPVSPQWGHFLGLQRVSTGLPHFSQVKMAIIFLRSTRCLLQPA